MLWPLLLSLGVLAVIGYLTYEPDAFRQALQTLNPWWLAAAAGTVVLRVGFGAWRLHYVSHGRLDLAGGLRGQLAWDFFSNVTPSTIGGGPIAAAFLARDRRLPTGEAASIMLFAMLLDQLWFALSIPMLLVGGLYFEIIPRSLGAVGVWTFTAYFVFLMAWVLVFGYFTLFRPHLLERIVNGVFRLRLLRRSRARVAGVMQQLRHRARILRAQRADFYVQGFLLTLAAWVCRYLLVVFIIWSVYPELDAVLAFLRTMALTLGSLIMPTPGGAGGLEGLYALFLGPPLVPEALVAPTLLAWRVLGYYVFIALGAFLTMHEVQRSLRRTRRERLADANGRAEHEPHAENETLATRD
ncbi:MAG: lysylphosphatidylglycerol synthase transmembrane domain-containing protein [Rhodothermales bacterium]|nr:lysylphosphatidylglycerol synthase transmembrane domain-containing protein [Rhodothermales bacterium]